MRKFKKALALFSALCMIAQCGLMSVVHADEAITVPTPVYDLDLTSYDIATNTGIKNTGTGTDITTKVNIPTNTNAAVMTKEGIYSKSGFTPYLKLDSNQDYTFEANETNAQTKGGLRISGTGLNADNFTIEVWAKVDTPVPTEDWYGNKLVTYAALTTSEMSGLLDASVNDEMMLYNRNYKGNNRYIMTAPKTKDNQLISGTIYNSSDSPGWKDFWNSREKWAQIVITRAYTVDTNAIVDTVSITYPDTAGPKKVTYTFGSATRNTDPVAAYINLMNSFQYSTWDSTALKAGGSQKTANDMSVADVRFYDSVLTPDQQYKLYTDNAARFEEAVAIEDAKILDSNGTEVDSVADVNGAFSITATGVSNIEDAVFVAGALYDSQDKLLEVDSADLIAETETPFELNFTQAGNTFKLFVWDAETFRPLQNVWDGIN